MVGFKPMHAGAQRISRSSPKPLSQLIHDGRKENLMEMMRRRNLKRQAKGSTWKPTLLCTTKAAAQSVASLEQVGSEGHALSAVLSEGLSLLALQTGWLF
ncbi:hypothetical protein Q7C36_011266 [Tachysurus vachellii]|uniref:Uncharacterized protein n=1 Tax=Tachysurus vachellii TaxID=175792 RepID=A0AA88MQW3_TACVA|nr:hypothetical protein Q7C36_011266 [Tachysurus vachellii]